MADGVVQRLVDELAALLHRSVEVDDRQIRPLALSAQHGTLDEVRIDAVLRRRTSREVIAFAESFGIRTATAPVRIPASERLGTLPRVCIPVRDETGGHWGYLWLIDTDPVVDADEVTAAAQVAEAIAAELRRNAGTSDAELAVERHLVDSLLEIGEPHVPDPRQPAAHRQVLEESRLPAGEPWTVLVCGVRGCTDAAAAVAELTVARERGRTLLGWVDGYALVVGAATTLERRLGLVRRSLGDIAARWGFDVLGVGLGPATSLVGELPGVHRRAAYAARIAEADPARSGFARWSELGPDAAFYGLPWTVETVEVFHPGAMRLVTGSGGAPLGETVLAFLEAGGDSRLASQRLAIHRTTLYYRLDRARELLGHGWEGDADRLGLHLALRLGRLVHGS